jgi:endonuclease/exonuclease/phosphatase family metal-dependent hydrolase
MWPLLSIFSTSAARSSSAIRLVSFNIHAWRDSDHRLNFDRLVAQLQRLRPDIVCLNEVLHPFCAPAPDDPYWEAVRDRRGHGYEPPEGSVPADEAESLLMRLSQAAELPHVAYGAASEGAFFGRYPFGNAILSRHALQDVRRLVLPLQDGDLTLARRRRPVALSPRRLLHLLRLFHRLGRLRRFRRRRRHLLLHLALTPRLRSVAAGRPASHPSGS